MNHTVPFEEKSNGQHEDRRGGLAVEDEDEGVDAMVEGRLGDDEHARVDELCDEDDQVRLLKDRRRRPEGGEWKPIKIPRRNLAYIPKMTRRPSLPTRPRPPSYRSAIDPRNRARNHSGNTEQC
jgi:hypothetical protein